jgi:hypothetical protein
MAEVFRTFDGSVTGSDGRSYIARACGRGTESGSWEGWIEFTPDDGSTPLRTSRETTQPNRTDLAYWAGGLRTTYLEGALGRALAPRTPPPDPPVERPAFDSPAPATRSDVSRAAAQPRPPRAVLDPFAVYAEGGDVLRSQLGALSPAQLRNIARAYGLAPDPDRLELLHRAELVPLIVEATARRMR